MKRNYLIVLFIGCTFFINAQLVNYKTIKDEPKDAANLHINFELLHIETSLKNISGTSFNLGLNSVYNFKNKIGGEVTFRKSYVPQGVKGHTQFGIGTFYNFASKTKVRDQKIVLDSKTVRKGGKDYTETTSIQVPSSVLKSFGVRFGMDYTSEFLEAELKYQNFVGDYRYQSTGVYFGYLYTSQMNTQIDTDSYGLAAHRFIRRYYVDGLIYPGKKITSIPGDVLHTGPKGEFFGWRAGVEFLSPEPRRVHKNSMYIKVEAGMRPLDGIYMVVAAGISFKRKLKSSSAYKQVRETE
ncbi:MAG: hypothetical protein PHQ74_11190 [Crocinitomicaceae bacterium]|nr:hypothetical protein [Crocinitomicaceae bacterium]